MTDPNPNIDTGYPPIAPGVTYSPAHNVDRAIDAAIVYQMARDWGGDEGSHALYCAAMKILDLTGPVESVHDYFALMPNGQCVVNMMPRKGARR